MISVPMKEFFDPILLSLKVSLIASILVFIVAVLIARFMSRASFRGKTLLETLFMLPLVLPPTVVGFILLVIFGRKSWVGRSIEWLFGQPLVFTWYAAVIASVIVSFPLIYQTVKVGFQSIDRAIEDAGRSYGANEWQVFRWITLPLAFPSLISGFILGFARGLGEFGATLMLAGNIPGKTQTLPTAIYLAVDSGNNVLAWLWSICIILISFLMLMVANRKITNL
ncbi:molybdenum ABC transporter permease subunit [Paenibacillus selenitireducens]|uniref:Molybdenum transport system permease n=1 Tax=Paenibacillus selenitireducens TaxID=1324314 RepID=A0A1T2XMY8_9BACL|nr:molybdate ABC transporter permease subunit [Paenibacillus selenitireducens]OPA81188.1 molybdenum ABC transporter permease subunit [Paenibacillus selenitireducens]